MVVRTPEHKMALEAVVLSSFTTAKPCDRKGNYPPGATARAEAMGAEVVMPRHRNPPDGDGGPNHWEVWLRDLDGYKVVLASPDGTADGAWRPWHAGTQEIKENA